jgi:hypothetical protein
VDTFEEEELVDMTAVNAKPIFRTFPNE